MATWNVQQRAELNLKPKENPKKDIQFLSSTHHHHHHHHHHQAGEKMEETPSINHPPADNTQTPSVSEDDDHQSEPKPLFDQSEIFKALEIIERDSISIAESYTSLFSSLRLALSEVTSSSVDHMHCFSDVVGRLQESAIDAATRGNRYINSCLRLNEEMKSVESLAIQLKILRKNVDTLDSAVTRLVRLP